MSAISVENLSKRYVIGHEVRHDTLRDTLAHGVRSLWSRLRENRIEQEEFWALRDVSFEVQPGEVVGIIGRNGAGKSTLLKILSRITEPTTGTVRLRGRVASLLEVGTGFHPELTGRDNIFLNGAILGMSRAEIRRKFDEIVAFAEVERFLDTPVKRYSSGMYVRLAFAVAAHLDPEILIVDEVLAVGDAEFQKKCLGRMRYIAEGQGRTVIFVSHNLGVIHSLCKSALLLDVGRLAYRGLPIDTISQYQITRSNPLRAAERTARTQEDPSVLITGHRIVHECDRTLLQVDVELRSTRPLRAALEILVSSADGLAVGLADAGTLNPGRGLQLPSGFHTTTWAVDASLLASGNYYLCAQLVEPMVRKLSVHEYSQLVEINRPAHGGATRVLDQKWQVGSVELQMHRVS